MSPVSVARDIPANGRTAARSSAFWQLGSDRSREWGIKGHTLRHFFPHHFYQLPKCGPDGFLLAERMCGIDDPQAMWELVLYADPSLLDEFPRDLFFDDELIWHQQQFGRPGQVATASLACDGSTVHAVTLQSDLVQRISRHRSHKTRIGSVFRGWSHMLLNAVWHFAATKGARTVRIATADLAYRHTDPARSVDRGIFDRIYDGSVRAVFPTLRERDWWVVDVEQARARMLVPDRRTETRRNERTICVLHDVERGLGHREVDAKFAQDAERASPRALVEMRHIEAELGVRTTYCVVGSLLPEVRDGLALEGQCLAFHSFDHRIDQERQLPRCRGVDYRLKGYRVPASKITEELSERNLLRHNFEWLASSSQSLGTAWPEMRSGVVRLPVAVDDFAMHDRDMPYEEWEREALRLVAEREFTAIGLHDCYAPHWLERYRGFLRRLMAIGELRTMDDVAAEVALASAA